MKKILNLLLLYFIIGSLNTVLFTSYLRTSSLPGGDIGMMPILITIQCLISLTISVVIVLISKLLKKEFNFIKAVLIYHLIYFILIGYESFGSLFSDFKDPYIQLDLWLIGIALVLLGVSILIAKYLDKRNNNIVV